MSVCECVCVCVKERERERGREEIERESVCLWIFHRERKKERKRKRERESLCLRKREREGGETSYYNLRHANVWNYPKDETCKMENVIFCEKKIKNLTKRSFFLWSHSPRTSCQTIWTLLIFSQLQKMFRAKFFQLQ